MKKWYPAFYFCFFIMSITYAQNTAITLQLPIVQQSQTSSNIASIEVVSTLGDSAFIGVLPSVYPNVRTNVLIEQGVQVWLQDYVVQQFGNSFQANGKKLAWIIKELRIGKDSLANGSTSFTKLTADVYSKESDGNYHLLSTFDTLMITKNLSTDFGQYLAVALNALYNKSATGVASKAQQKPQAQRSTINNKNILALSDNILDSIKILSDSIYTPGIFLSFVEFLNNAPSITNFFTSVDSATRQVQLYQFMDDSSSQLISQAWGISINNELYRYKNGQLYAIEKDGNSFILSKYVDFQIRKNQALFWRKYIGEFQGDNNPFNDQHVYRISLNGNPNTTVEATVIDLSTGEIASY